MCYRASVIKDKGFMEKRYQAKINPEYEQYYDDYVSYHFNGFGHPSMLIVPEQKPEILTPALWGIMPSNETIANKAAYYTKAARFGGGLNAKSEAAFSHFIYRHSIMSYRCLIPLSGFIEPHTGDDKSKYPFYFKRKDNDLLSVAGIYSVTKDGGITYAMFTKKGSPLFSKIHNLKERQIVLLDKETEQAWLDPDLNESQIKDIFNLSFDESVLEVYPLSNEVYKRKNSLQGEELIAKKDYPKLKPLMAEVLELTA